MPKPPAENTLIHALIDDYLAYNGFEGARAVLETGESHPAQIPREQTHIASCTNA